LGLAAARAGRRALLCEVAGSSRASALLSTEEVGHEQPVQLAPELFGIAIDVDHSTERYLASQLRVRPLVDMLSRSKAFHQFTAAAPGLAELVTLGAIWSLAVELRPGGERPVWDLVVVDCPATGHGVALLETAANIRSLSAQGPITEQSEQIEQVIKHPGATGVVLVARPDELPVTEAADAAEALRQRDLPLALAVMNAVTPQRFKDEEAGALTAASLDGGGASSAAATAALAHLERQAVEAVHLEHLAAGTDLPVLELPMLVREEFGLEAVQELARAAAEGLEGMGW